ncbi:MAG TPA: 1-acyl-sn-glycerol-3-phosphate acyltransferase [Xanthobacteraceae bacterium]|jgi:1-acyl-sn-glycerol-3-phosphate acyltransferase|nr:1-acyl-sn-glycerol-3-phosphate acyltransferase [Xanthobacteraceae bacterium]
MIRTAFIAAALVLATLIGIPLQWLSIKLGLPTRRLIPMYYHRLCLKLFGVRVEVRGSPTKDRPLLFVANHSSWLDHLILSGTTPVVFIAKKEIASWPVFGLLAKLQRSVFVDRERRHKTGAVTQEISTRLTNGDPVVLYGEGTTGDGNRVLPFRSALLGAMGMTVGPGENGYLQPVSIAYTRLQGLPMGRQHRPVAAWFGNTNIIKHIGRVLRMGGIDAVVTFGTAMVVTPEMDRKSVAKSLEQSVRRMTTAARLARPEIAISHNALEISPGAVSLPADSR